MDKTIETQKLVRKNSTDVNRQKPFFDQTPTEILDSMEYLKCNTLECWVQNTLNTVIVIAALLAIVFMVYAGFLYIFSQGKEDKVEKAQKTMAYTIVGLILVFIAPLLIKFVLANFVGLR